jgi:phage baseplate assembly protein V
MIDALLKLLEPIKRRISLLIGRSILLLGDDSGSGNQRFQVSLMAEEIRDDMERFQEYGFTSKPIAGAEGIVLFPGGTREIGYIIATDDRRFRFKPLGEGEVAIYTTLGDRIHLKATGEIEINAMMKVVVNSPSVELGSGSLESLVNGEAFQTLFNNHVHTGNLGAPTSPPMSPMTTSHLSQTVKAAT